MEKKTRTLRSYTFQELAFGKIPYLLYMGFVTKFRKKYMISSSRMAESINNVSANYVFLRLFFIVFSITKTYFKYPIKMSLLYSLVSSLFYMYVSTFFQPDLDNSPIDPENILFLLEAGL